MNMYLYVTYIYIYTYIHIHTYYRTPPPWFLVRVNYQELSDSIEWKYMGIWDSMIECVYQYSLFLKLSIFMLPLLVIYCDLYVYHEWRCATKPST